MSLERLVGCFPIFVHSQIHARQRAKNLSVYVRALTPRDLALSGSFVET
jgi:hypothetical protein